MKKIFGLFLSLAIIVSSFANISAYYTWTGPVVNGKTTTCLETRKKDGDMSASRFKSITNLSSSNCERLSSTHYNQVLNGTYTYMYAQYFYNSTVNSVFNTNFGTNGIMLSNSGA